MRILYLWIKEYKEFKDQEFKLNSQYKFSYDKKFTITCEKNDLYIDNFFSTDNEDRNVSRVKEVTAIVGNNGVGKTTFLELLMNLSYLKEHKDLEYILIYKYRNKIRVNSSKYKINIHELDNQNIIHQDKDDKVFEKMKFIYHSSTFDNKTDNMQVQKNVYDISTNNLIIEDNEKRNKNRVDKQNKNNYNQVFFQEELKRQIEFIAKHKESTQFLTFDIPSKLIIKFIDFNGYLDYIQNRIDTYNKSNKLQRIIDDNGEDGKSILDEIYYNIDSITYRMTRSYENKDSTSLFKSNIVKGVLLNIIDEIIPIPNKEKNDEEYIVKTIKKFNNILGYHYENIKICLNYEDYIDEIKKLIQSLSIQYAKYTKLFSEISESLNILLNNIDSYDIQLIDDETYSINILSENKLKLFYNLYVKIIFKHEIMRFSWGLSSGENNLINLFSRLYYTYQHNFENKTYDFENINILIDEADLGFHPEWQRKYMEMIIDFINNTFKGYDIHIILTTHSPILLSDIPNENLIYLSKKDNKVECMRRDNRTFGANIYNLYKDNFYFEECDDSINTMGTFAEIKIAEAENIIKTQKDIIVKYGKVNNVDFKYKLNKAYKIINKIGEKVIRDVLLEEYYKVYNPSEELNINKIKESYESLTSKEKQFLIEYIISKHSKEVR